LFVRIATQNSFLPKVNRLFTKKRALKMSPIDALNAEGQESNKECPIVIMKDGKKESFALFFIACLYNSTLNTARSCNFS
jgi:hypothetical protein